MSWLCKQCNADNARDGSHCAVCGAPTHRRWPAAAELRPPAPPLAWWQPGLLQMLLPEGLIALLLWLATPVFAARLILHQQLLSAIALALAGLIGMPVFLVLMHHR